MTVYIHTQSFVYATQHHVSNTGDNSQRLAQARIRGKWQHSAKNSK